MAFKMAFAGIESDLKRTMDVSTSGLLLKLKDNKIINGEQYNLIKAEKTEDIKVTTLLDILGRADEEKLPLFYKLLEESGHKDVTQKLKRNETKRRRESSKQGKETSPDVESPVAEPKSRKRRASQELAESSSRQTSTGRTVSPQTFSMAFAGNESKLEDKLDASDNRGLLGKLEEKRIITRRQRDHIEAEKTNANRVNELLKTLGRTDNKKLPVFYEALEETNQEDVIQMLKGKETKRRRESSKQGKETSPDVESPVAEPKSVAGKTDVRDVFISYCWDQQDIARRIKDRLEKDRLKVWFDEEDMSGNVTDAMSGGIKQSSVVVFCYSEGYERSRNCRKEAEYADKKKKEMVPVRVQARYEPKGWLDILLGSKLYFDLSEENFDDDMKKLLIEIRRARQRANAGGQ